MVLHLKMSDQHCSEPRNVSTPLLGVPLPFISLQGFKSLVGREFLGVEMIEKLVRFLCAPTSTYFLHIDLDF